MPRNPDPNSPARIFRIRGDCLSEAGAALLLFVWFYHNFDLPPDSHEPFTPLP